jgi:hypothetical protein
MGSHTRPTTLTQSGGLKVSLRLRPYVNATASVKRIPSAKVTDPAAVDPLRRAFMLV